MGSTPGEYLLYLRENLMMYSQRRAVADYLQAQYGSAVRTAAALITRGVEEAVVLGRAYVLIEVTTDGRMRVATSNRP